MTEHGYIALARGVLDHPVVGASKPYSDFEAWTWLLTEAAWKQRRVRVTNGRTVSALVVERGQLSYSLSYMANAWDWSVKRVRTFLGRLEADGITTMQTGTQQSIITVCNYDLYQLRTEAKGTQTGSQRARNGHETEEGNNLKKDNTLSLAGESEGFAEWYAIYPRKKQPIAAAKAFAKIMASGQITLADLLKRTLAFAQSQQGKDRQFIPYPATWLNAGGYKDEPDAATTTTSPGAIAAPERDPRTFTDDEWRERLAAPSWSPSYWGPLPGTSGCLVPGRLLVAPAEQTRTTGAANG